MKRWELAIVIWFLVNLIGSLLLLLIVLPFYFKNPDKPVEIILSFEFFLFVGGYSLVLSLPALISYLVIVLSKKKPLSKFLKQSFRIISYLVLITFIVFSLIGQNILYGFVYFIPFSLAYIFSTWIVIRLLRYYYFKRGKNVPN